MATIRPFCGLRFSDAAGRLEDLVAPPYDVLSKEERDEFAAKSAYNVVHLTLPDQNPDDRSKFVKYARSAAALQAWRNEGVLQLDATPGYYRYSQEFDVPGKNRRVKRLALIATIKVEPYDKGVVLPHEKTFPKHKEDRLRILEATRSHLECIYGLFEDDDRALFDQISRAPGETVFRITTEDGVSHQIDRIVDSAAITQLTNAMQSKKVWIADGHHRYETACTFRETAGPSDDQIAEDYMMMALSSMTDPGLELLPTHRILTKVELSPQQIKDQLMEHFETEHCPNADLVSNIAAEDAQGKRAFGVAFPGGKGMILKVGDPSKYAVAESPSESDRLQQLDVTILHRKIFDQILGLRGLEFFNYTRDAEEALDSVDQGAPAAFLMNPPTIEDMRLIAAGGEKMPQKSTYYYPKILSGMVIWSLNDYQP